MQERQREPEWEWQANQKQEDRDWQRQQKRSDRVWQVVLLFLGALLRWPLFHVLK
jgi:hypothetical protein